MKDFNLILMSKDLGLCIMRVGIGLIFVKHGYEKLVGGSSIWMWVGQQMIVIQQFPLFWGMLAMITELAGGLCFALGFYTRIVSCLLAFVMLVAVNYHMSNHDDFGKISNPLSLLFVFVGFILIGGGSLSIDTYLSR
jgi:putative oxidoreductase